MTDTSYLRHRMAPITMIGGFLMFVVIFLEPLAVLMGPLEMSIARHIAADNMVTMILATVAICVRFRVTMRQETHLHKYVVMHRLGELALLVGLALHRGFWIPWWVAHEGGNTVFKTWWADGPVVITTFGQSFWWLGCVLLCSPQLSQMMPKTWPYAVAAAVPSLWLISYQAVDVVAMVIPWSN